MSIKHTPGPWKVEQSDDLLLILSEKRDTVAQVYAVHRTDLPYDQANAHLIAAAPELLESLKALMSLIDSGYLVRNTDDDAKPDFALRQIKPVSMLHAAHLAIIKAEGSHE